MTTTLVRREIQNRHFHAQGTAPLTRLEKTRAFLRGGLTEVSIRALEKGESDIDKQAMHLER